MKKLLLTLTLVFLLFSLVIINFTSCVSLSTTDYFTYESIIEIKDFMFDDFYSLIKKVITEEGKTLEIISDTASDNGTILCKFYESYAGDKIISNITFNITDNTCKILISDPMIQKWNYGLEFPERRLSSKKYFDEKVLWQYKRYIERLEYSINNEKKEYDRKVDNEKKEFNRMVENNNRKILNQQKVERYREIVKVNINRAKNAGSPILIYNYETRSPNSAGGVSCNIRFVNISHKRIKYIYFTVVPYNSVDDKAYSSIGNTSEITLDHTGYIDKNNIDDFSKLQLIFAGWSNVWYNSNIRYMKITKIEVVFDDNNKITMNNNMITSSIFFSEEELDSNIRQILDDGR